MATNSYFRSQSGVASEQNLVERMVIENIQISGNDLVYIPRTLNKFDQIFGEDVLSSFNSYATIEMYLSDFTGYGGESEMMSKFGMEIRDTASFLVSRKRFVETVTPIFPVTRDNSIANRPCEGDLIYVPFSRSLFEIKFVEDEAPGFYQLNKKYVWTLRCELVQLNNETFATGLDDVDSQFNRNLNRLNSTLITESGFGIMMETGGNILSEDYVESRPYDELLGYGDDAAIKSEFLAIMDFSENNPFNERF